MALEDARFQLQQKELISPHRRLSTIAMLPIPWTDFQVPLKLDAHPTSRFGKMVRRNLGALTTYHKNKCESIGLIHGYYVVGMTAIPYPGFGVLLNIVSKDDIKYRVTNTDMSHCTCSDFTKMLSQSLQKKKKWVYCKHFYYVFKSMWIVDYDSDKFIHAPTYSYDEVMRLLELVSVVECK